MVGEALEVEQPEARSARGDQHLDLLRKGQAGEGVDHVGAEQVADDHQRRGQRDTDARGLHKPGGALIARGRDLELVESVDPDGEQVGERDEPGREGRAIGGVLGEEALSGQRLRHRSVPRPAAGRIGQQVPQVLSHSRRHDGVEQQRLHGDEEERADGEVVL